MNNTIRTILLITILIVSGNIWAQKGDKKKQLDAAAKVPVKKSNYVAKSVMVYLGHSSICSGVIPKRTFDSLIRQGLVAKDSVGNYYRINGFNFNYVLRSFDEDSLGKVILTTEYLQEYCNGDTLSNAIKRNILGITKPGDTVYIDQIKTVTQKGDPIPAKSLKIVLSK
jgi:hypothetical protein